MIDRILGLVPTWLWALAVLLLAAATGVQSYRLTTLHGQLAQEALDGQESVRESERLANADRSRSMSNAATQIEVVRRDAAGAHTVARQLRDAAVRIAAARDAAGDSGPVAPGGDAAGPGLVPPKLLLGVGADVAASAAEMAAAGADLAEALARARVANDQCRAEYGAAQRLIGRLRGEVTP